MKKSNAYCGGLLSRGEGLAQLQKSDTVLSNSQTREFLKRVKDNKNEEQTLRQIQTRPNS